MTTRHAITETLISCRNILLGGHINDHVLPCLEGVLSDLDSVEILTTKEIIRYCVTEVVNQVKAADFVSAARILNLIHNLPLNESNERQWNVDYFLSMELPAFLENFSEIKSARLISLFVCEQLAHRYLSDGVADEHRKNESLPSRA